MTTVQTWPQGMSPIKMLKNGESGDASVSEVLALRTFPVLDPLTVLDEFPPLTARAAGRVGHG